MPCVACHHVRVMALAKEASATVTVFTVDSTANSKVSPQGVPVSQCIALFGNVTILSHKTERPHHTRTEAFVHCLKDTLWS